MEFSLSNALFCRARGSFTLDNTLLHRIEDRVVVVDGQMVIRPMMYIALSYDHRLIDGREAVTTLKIIKEAIEDPTRLLIDL